MPEQAYTAKTPTVPPVTTPTGWPSGWAWPGPPWPPGWPAAPWLTVALSKSIVDVDETFTMTVTAYDSTGAVDTTYASTTLLTDDNADCALQTSGGVALTQLVAGDFALGIAVKTVRLHATNLNALAAVTLTAAKSTDATVTGSGSIDVRDTNFHLVTIASFSKIAQANPDTQYPSPALFRAVAPDLADTQEVRCFVKFSSPLVSLRCTNFKGASGSYTDMLVQARWSANKEAAFWMDIILDAILQDFTPGDMTWNNQGGLSYAGALTRQGPYAQCAAGAVFNANQTYSAWGMVPNYNAPTSQLFVPAAYGFRIRLTITTSDVGVLVSRYGTAALSAAYMQALGKIL